MKKESTPLLVTPDAFAKDEKTRHMLVYSDFKVVEQKLVVLKPADVLRLLKLEYNVALLKLKTARGGCRRRSTPALVRYGR